MTVSERKWVAPETAYTIENGCVHTDGTHIQKITGTSMGGLLGVSPYATPYSTTTKLMGVWDEDIGDKPQVIAGKLLEGRIIEYGGKTYDGSFYPAEMIYAERSGKHSEWKSDFEDDVFAGHVDGIVTKDGQDYILEVKTASPLSAEQWREHPPAHYLWQVYLYNHFVTKQDKAYMLLGIVDPKFYGNPNLWIPDKSNTFLFEVPIDQKAVAKTIEELRELYANTVRKGVSLPCGENEIDRELLQHLTDIQMPSSELKALIDEYLALRESNEEYAKRNEPNVVKEEELKERIKDVMVTNSIERAGQISVRTSERKTFDFKTADIEGFDYTKYVKMTSTNALIVNKRRD